MKTAGAVWQEVLPTRALEQHRVDLHATVSPGQLLIPAKVAVKVVP